MKSKRHSGTIMSVGKTDTQDDFHRHSGQTWGVKSDGYNFIFFHIIYIQTLVLSLFLCIFR